MEGGIFHASTGWEHLLPPGLRQLRDPWAACRGQWDFLVLTPLGCRMLAGQAVRPAGAAAAPGRRAGAAGIPTARTGGGGGTAALRQRAAAVDRLALSALRKRRKNLDNSRKNGIITSVLNQKRLDEVSFPKPDQREGHLV